MAEKKTKGKLVVISGPSGVGKSTICRRVVEQLENAFISVSATTRQQAAGEVDGQHYWFLTKEEFQERRRERLFLETAEVFGNYYGTPKDKTDEALAAGRTVILEIDVQGGQQVKKIYPQAMLIFILPPTEGELQKRLSDRGRDDQKTVQMRLSQASHEIAIAWAHYDHMVINDKLEDAVHEIVTLVTAMNNV